MTDAAKARYRARMQRVLDHVDRYLDEDLSLDTLSAVAAFSRFHFHRQFTELFGISVHRYVQLARLRRASHELVYTAHASITDIALDAGYETPDAFARVFRQKFGQSPSEFRRVPDWQSWHAVFGQYSSARNTHMTRYTPRDVVIRDFPPTPVAILTHRGEPYRLRDTVRRFVAWRRANGLRKEESDTFTVFRNRQTDTEEVLQIDLCVASERLVAPNDTGVVSGLIAGGRCAVLRVIGSSDDMREPADFLYREWLPGSGEEPRDFPLFCQRLTFYPDVPESETLTDLFLPIR